MEPQVSFSSSSTLLAGRAQPITSTRSRGCESQADLQYTVGVAQLTADLKTRYHLAIHKLSSFPSLGADFLPEDRRVPVVLF